MRVAVIGLGRFGHSLALSLADRGAEVIAIDKDREAVDAVKDKVALAVIMDSEDNEALRAQGVDKADVAVISIGEESFRSNVLTTIHLKKMGVKTVISRAFEDIDREILENIGADKVVFPEDESGIRLARSITSTGVIDYISLDDNETYTMAQIEAPKRFWGKKIGDLRIAARYNVNIVLVKHLLEVKDKRGDTVIKEEVNPVPRADDVINQGDVLWVVGTTEDVEHFSHL
ncbi:TrkA family potassium uptake protein [Candidatus Poribacteria bacterium]|nr:TrkA family potassium uptake protein [Candidatus Poribacteria bacterium]